MTAIETERSQGSQGQRANHKYGEKKQIPPELNLVTGQIVNSAVKVHSRLGPGLLESAYEACLVHELIHRKFSVERQVTMPIQHEGVQLDAGYRLDLLVDKKVIVEIKAVESLQTIHEAQLMTYLRLAGLKVGLILNFNALVMKSGIRRIVL